MTRQGMTDVLIERLISYWMDGGIGEAELEGILLYGWKGYDEYSDKEIKDAFEQESLDEDEIQEYLESSKQRYEDRAKPLEIHELPF